MSDTRKKITSADTITLKSHVLPKGEARDRDFATAKPAGAPSGPSSYNFVLPNGATRADDAGSFFGPPSDFQAAMSGPVVQRIRAMSAPHPAQVYSYGNRDYASFADAEKANPNMAQISNPQSGEDLCKGYEMERGRAFVNSIGTGAVGLGPIAYNLGASPEAIQASGQFDEALGGLGAGIATRVSGRRAPFPAAQRPSESALQSYRLPGLEGRMVDRRSDLPVGRGEIDAQDIARASKILDKEMAYYRDRATGQRYLRKMGQQMGEYPYDSRLIMHTQPGDDYFSVMPSELDRIALEKSRQKSSTIVNSEGNWGMRFRPDRRFDEPIREYRNGKWVFDFSPDD